MATKTKRAPKKDQPTRTDRPADESSGVIRADEAYTLDALKRRLDISDSAWWSLLEQGFPNKQLGKRKVILGREVLEFLQGLPNVSTAD